MASSLSKRNLSLDILRIYAMLSVVMVHCAAEFVTHYDAGSVEFFCGNIFDSISRAGVPIFLMISGALFLNEDKEVSINSIFTKYIKDLALITLFWSLFYTVIYNILFPVLKGGEIDFKIVLEKFILGNFHMWYLYMNIGLYIITPFLRKFVCKENKNLVLLFIAVSLIFVFSKPVITMICDMGIDIKILNDFLGKFELDFFGGYITYYLCGWYIVHIGINKKIFRYTAYLIGLLSVVLIITYIQTVHKYKAPYENIGLPVFAYSTSIFIALNNIKFKISDKITKIVLSVSKISFGVYIIHVVILYVFVRVFKYTDNPLAYTIVMFLSVSGISLVISYVISKIPVIKKLIKA